MNYTGKHRFYSSKHDKASRDGHAKAKRQRGGGGGGRREYEVDFTYPAYKSIADTSSSVIYIVSYSVKVWSNNIGHVNYHRRVEY